MSEPESNSLTSEELATRVRRVVGRRFRRDSAAQLEPVTKFTPQLPNWTTRGYDFLIISLAIFLVCILVLNLSIAGSWRERGRQWEDRALWQRELHAWEQQLVQQEKLLAAQCQHLAATMMTYRSPDEEHQALDRIKELRQGLRDANQSLVDLNISNSDPHHLVQGSLSELSSEALLTLREQLIEQQYTARAQSSSQHPTVQAIELQLQEVERRIALSQAANGGEYATEPVSRVQVIENQFLHNASSSPQTRPSQDRAQVTPQLQLVEQRFSQLRSMTERFLRDLETQQQASQLANQERATAWEQVANTLRAMTRACTVPAGLQQAVAKQNELRTEPTLTPISLVLCLVISPLIACALIGSAPWVKLQKVSPGKVNSEERINLKIVTQQLGCAPGAIVPWDIAVARENTVIETSQPELAGKSRPEHIRLASECMLAVAIAATVLLALTHGQFGDWLVANPLTAWGRWLGS